MAGALGDRAAPLIARLRESEKSGPVLAAMDRVAGAVAASAPQAMARSPGQQDGKAGFIALDGEWIAAPPRGDMPPPGKIDPEALALLLPVIEAYNTKMLEDQARYKDVKRHWTRSFKPLHRCRDRKAAAFLRRMDHAVGFSNQNNFQWLFGYMTRHANIERFFDHPSVDLRHLARDGDGDERPRIFGQLLTNGPGRLAGDTAPRGARC